MDAQQEEPKSLTSTILVNYANTASNSDSASDLFLNFSNTDNPSSEDGEIALVRFFADEETGDALFGPRR